MHTVLSAAVRKIKKSSNKPGKSKNPAYISSEEESNYERKQETHKPRNKHKTDDLSKNRPHRYPSTSESASDDNSRVLRPSDLTKSGRRRPQSVTQGVTTDTLTNKDYSEKKSADHLDPRIQAVSHQENVSSNTSDGHSVATSEDQLAVSVDEIEPVVTIIRTVRKKKKKKKHMKHGHGRHYLTTEPTRLEPTTKPQNEDAIRESIDKQIPQVKATAAIIHPRDDYTLKPRDEDLIPKPIDNKQIEQLKPAADPVHRREDYIAVKEKAIIEFQKKSLTPQPSITKAGSLSTENGNKNDPEFIRLKQIIQREPIPFRSNPGVADNIRTSKRFSQNDNRSYVPQTLSKTQLYGIQLTDMESNFRRFDRHYQSNPHINRPIPTSAQVQPMRSNNSPQQFDRNNRYYKSNPNVFDSRENNMVAPYHGNQQYNQYMGSKPIKQQPTEIVPSRPLVGKIMDVQIHDNRRYTNPDENRIDQKQWNQPPNKVAHDQIPESFPGYNDDFGSYPSTHTTRHTADHRNSNHGQLISNNTVQLKEYRQQQPAVINQYPTHVGVVNSGANQPTFETEKKYIPAPFLPSVVPIASQVQHPQSQHPQSQHPQSLHPQSLHPQSQHPQSLHPQSLHPQSQHPQSQIRPTPEIESSEDTWPEPPDCVSFPMDQTSSKNVYGTDSSSTSFEHQLPPPNPMQHRYNQIISVTHQENDPNPTQHQYNQSIRVTHQENQQPNGTLVPSEFRPMKEDLHELGYYHSSLSRSEAEELLTTPGRPNGSFLIRSSFRFMELVLSVLIVPEVKHIKIYYNENGQYTLDQKFHPADAFGRLADLVKRFQTHGFGDHGYRLTEAVCQDKLADSMRHFSDEWTIDSSYLALKEELGRGRYGVVRLGILNEEFVVAVKTVKDTTYMACGDLTNFRREVSLLKQLRHPRLTRLVGVTTLQGQYTGCTGIIMEYLSNGNLLEYLWDVRTWVFTLKDGKKAAFGVQVAEGMRYLESQRVVHRDLAARNVLLSQDMTVKISDFGLARLLQEDVEVIQDSTHRPMRWMAPESLISKQFSSKTDSWSYGILLLEIYTLGESPYSNLPDNEVIPKLQGGYRAPQPKSCSTRIYYEIMRRCWDQAPNNRPNFSQILDKWNSILEK